MERNRITEQEGVRRRGVRVVHHIKPSSIVLLSAVRRSGAPTDTRTPASKSPPTHAPAAKAVETPLARFNARVNYWRPGAEQTAIDPTGRYNNTSATLLPSIPIVSFLDLMYMAFSSATSTAMMDERRKLFDRVQGSGGYCLIELSDACDVAILDGMWDAVEALFPESSSSSSGRPMGDAEKYSIPDLPLRRQVLTRERASMAQQAAPTKPKREAPPPCGYDFVQTTMVRDEIRPAWIPERIGAVGGQQTREAYLFLSQLAKAYATVLYAGATQSKPGEATMLMESLLNEPGRSFSGSYHRLCRYVRLGSKDASKSAPSWGESLGSHVDWTITTAIPVSAIDGLEIYDSSQNQWIRIERAARELGKQMRPPSNRVPATERRWNSHWVVLMAGAWMELLTNGTLESTLHRVVTDPQASRRLSCPYFMRPRELVFERTNQVFDNADDAAVLALGPEEALNVMSRFLREGEFLQA